MEIIIEIEDSASFDSNRPTTRQGVPVVNVGGETVNDFLDGYFFPGQSPSASLSGGTDKEKGDPNLAVNLIWSAGKGSEPITDIIIDGHIIPATGENQSGTYAGQLVQDVNKTFQLTVTDQAGKTTSANTSMNWKQANYYGVSSISPEEIISLLSASQSYAGNLITAKHLATSKAENHDYNCTGGKYIYVLYPALYGNPLTVKNGSFDFSDYSFADVTITDVFGIQRPYKLFYTGYQTGANVNINIIN